MRGKLMDFASIFCLTKVGWAALSVSESPPLAQIREWIGYSITFL